MPHGFLSTGYLADVRARGVALERTPTDRVVVTGYAMASPLGRTDDTWRRLKAGESCMREILGEDENKLTRIAGMLPDDYDPRALLHPKDDKLAMSEIAAMSIVESRHALQMAGLLDSDGRFISPDVDPRRVGVWISTGIAATDKIIDLHGIIKAKGARFIRPDLSLQIFPEQIAGRTAIAINAAGWAGNTSEACATGASNIVEAVELIRSGRADVAIAGGFEYSLHTHPSETIACFTAVRAMSKRNDDPNGASRPFDQGRDGFVASAGGAVVVLESAEHARRRGATRILAEILGVAKSNDGMPNDWDGGFKATELHPTRVADTIAEALYDRREGALRDVDAIFAHATSTPVGDANEAKTLRLVFEDRLPRIPITALKSMLGHLLGGAGSINITGAIAGMNDDGGFLPVIKNLAERDPQFDDLLLVQGEPMRRRLDSVLTLSYGFGGFNAVVHLVRGESG